MLVHPGLPVGVRPAGGVPAADADGGRHGGMRSRDVSENGMRLALDGQLLPGPQPPEDGPPGGEALHGPDPEDGADAHEEGHQVAQEEGPQGGTLSRR